MAENPFVFGQTTFSGDKKYILNQAGKQFCILVVLTNDEIISNCHATYSAYYETKWTLLFLPI